MEICLQCGANIALVGRSHRCIPKVTVQLPAPRKGLEITVKAGAEGLTVLPPTTETVKLRRGRPRIGEPHTKHEPWKALGMSERTYYRRQAEKRIK